ncbi:MAG: tetratricopeptide repeat protein [Alkalispirochaeta sp.]
MVDDVAFRPVRCGALLFWLLATVVSIPAQNRADALELYRQDRFQEAVEVTREELAENPANLDAYTVLGWSLLALNRDEDALEAGLDGLQVSRFDHRLLNIVGEAHYRLGNDTEALQYLQNYAAVAPTGSLIDEVYYVMGEVHLRLEEYHHADIALTTAVFLNSNRPRWWARLGYAREMAGSPEYAAEAYQEALDRNPNLIEAQRGLDRVAG